MPQGGGKKGAPKVVRSVGLAVQDELGFISDCAKALKKSLPLTHIQPKPSQSGYRKKTVRYVSAADDREIFGNPSLPFVASDPDYRLTLRLEFEHDGKCWHLTELFLHLFRFPRIEDASPYMLIRAEWDFRPQTKPTSHAQPHWHLVADNSAPDAGPATWLPSNEIRSATAFVDVVAASAEPATQEPTPNVARLHLAMAATWHMAPGEGSHVLKVAQPTEVNQWLSGVLVYLQEQVVYLCSKT